MLSASRDDQGKALQIENFKMQIENLPHCFHPDLSDVSQRVGMRAGLNLKFTIAICCLYIPFRDVLNLRFSIFSFLPSIPLLAFLCLSACCGCSNQEMKTVRYQTQDGLTLEYDTQTGCIPALRCVVEGWEDFGFKPSKAGRTSDSNTITSPSTTARTS